MHCICPSALISEEPSCINWSIVRIITEFGLHQTIIETAKLYLSTHFLAFFRSDRISWNSLARVLLVAFAPLLDHVHLAVRVGLHLEVHAVV